MPVREVSFPAPMAFAARAKASDSMDYGVDVTSTTTLGIHLSVDFEITAAGAEATSTQG
jgi:hypothetical protein